MVRPWLHGQKLYIKFKRADGTWSGWTRTEYGPGQKAQASRYRNKIEAAIAAGEPAPVEMTVQGAVSAYLDRAAKRTGARRMWAISSTRGRLKHFVAYCGELQLADVTAKEIKGLIAKVQKDHAPRTVLGVYACVRAFLHDCVCEALIERNPCEMLRRGDLPRKVDAHPEQREHWRFTVEEIALLLDDEHIPLRDRVTIALQALAGLRFGEASALCWRHLLTGMEPLWGLEIAWSFHRISGELKCVKSGVPRKVPVHPVLAELLERWHAEWARVFHRVPGADDLVVPADRGGHQRSNIAAEHFAKYQIALKLRRRWQHHLRHTFCSVLADTGADTGLSWRITHGPPATVPAGYTHPLWVKFCSMVAAMPFDVPDAEIRQMRKAVGADPCHNLGTTPFKGPSDGPKAQMVPKAGAGTSDEQRSATESGAQRDDGENVGPIEQHGSSRAVNCDKCSKRVLTRRALAALKKNRISEAIALLEQCGAED